MYPPIAAAAYFCLAYRVRDPTTTRSMCQTLNTRTNTDKQTRVRGRYMGKTLYGKYLDADGNIGSNLTLCVVCKVSVSITYAFQAILFTTLQVDVNVKLRTIKKYS